MEVKLRYKDVGQVRGDHFFRRVSGVTASAPLQYSPVNYTYYHSSRTGLVVFCLSALRLLCLLTLHSPAVWTLMHV